MKKYAIIALVLLGLGSCYYMNQNKEKATQQETTTVETAKMSLEDAKGKIDGLKYLTEEERVELKAKLDEAKDTNNFDSILVDAERINSKNKIDTLNYLTESEKNEFKTQLDGTKNLGDVESVLMNSENMNLKNKVDTLLYLSDDEKVEFKNKINSATSLDNLYSIVTNAEKVNFENKIDTLNYLSDDEKAKFKTQLNEAENEDGFFAVLKEAQELNANRDETKSGSTKDVSMNADKLSTYFAFDSYELTATDKAKIKEFVEKHKVSKISIVGHTDLIGTNEYNQELSVKRAKAVSNYLKNTLKVDVEIDYSGDGELNPISDIDAKNRRADIKFY